MTDLAAKAVGKFKVISEAMMELEKTDNWYSKELKYLDERRRMASIKEFDYYQNLYQLKDIVLNIILKSL